MSDGNNTPMENQQPVQNVAVVQEAPKKRKKGGPLKTLLKVLLWVVVIAAVVFLTLFLVSRIGPFGSIGKLFEYLQSQI